MKAAKYWPVGLTFYVFKISSEHFDVKFVNCIFGTLYSHDLFDRVLERILEMKNLLLILDVIDISKKYGLIPTDGYV